jgi:hypothetical protein
MCRKNNWSRRFIKYIFISLLILVSIYYLEYFSLLSGCLHEKAIQLEEVNPKFNINQLLFERLFIIIFLTLFITLLHNTHILFDFFQGKINLKKFTWKPFVVTIIITFIVTCFISFLFYKWVPKSNCRFLDPKLESKVLERNFAKNLNEEELPYFAFIYDLSQNKFSMFPGSELEKDISELLDELAENSQIRYDTFYIPKSDTTKDISELIADIKNEHPDMYTVIIEDNDSLEKSYEIKILTYGNVADLFAGDSISLYTSDVYTSFKKNLPPIIFYNLSKSYRNDSYINLEYEKLLEANMSIKSTELESRKSRASLYFSMAISCYLLAKNPDKSDIVDYAQIGYDCIKAALRLVDIKENLNVYIWAAIYMDKSFDAEILLQNPNSVPEETITRYIRAFDDFSLFWDKFGKDIEKYYPGKEEEFYGLNPIDIKTKITRINEVLPELKRKYFNALLNSEFKIAK